MLSTHFWSSGASEQWDFLDNVDQLIILLLILVKGLVLLGDFAGSFGEAWEALLKFKDIREALADLQRNEAESSGDKDEFIVI